MTAILETPPCVMPAEPTDHLLDDPDAFDQFVALESARVARLWSIDQICGQLGWAHTVGEPMDSPKVVAWQRAAVLVSLPAEGPETALQHAQRVTAMAADAREAARHLSDDSLRFLRMVRDGDADTHMGWFLRHDGTRVLFRACDVDDAEDLTHDGLIDRHGGVTDFGLLVLTNYFNDEGNDQ